MKRIEVFGAILYLVILIVTCYYIFNNKLTEAIISGTLANTVATIAWSPAEKITNYFLKRN